MDARGFSGKGPDPTAEEEVPSWSEDEKLDINKTPEPPPDPFWNYVFAVIVALVLAELFRRALSGPKKENPFLKSPGKKRSKSKAKEEHSHGHAHETEHKHGPDCNHDDEHKHGPDCKHDHSHGSGSGGGDAHAHGHAEGKSESKPEEKPAVPSDPSRLQQDAKPISEAELVGRLDSVPVFTLVQPDPKDTGVVIARLDDGRPFFFMDANDCATKLKEWTKDHPENMLVHVTGLGSAVAAVARLNAKIVPRGSDLAMAAKLPSKEEVDWSDGEAVPLFACHKMLQVVNGNHVKPLFTDGDDAEGALAQARKSAGEAAASLELVVVSLHKMVALLSSGQVIAGSVRMIPSTKSLRAVASLEQQVQSKRADVERQKALQAALGEDATTGDGGGEEEVD
eukprot:Transcript_24665.p1 GENE.Transcript_24665~~Transcript_24665.p1  ORF type:complete len:396 (+),score=166.11 Transcript_24665:81-1268(+)